MTLSQHGIRKKSPGFLPPCFSKTLLWSEAVSAYPRGMLLRLLTGPKAADEVAGAAEVAEDEAFSTKASFTLGKVKVLVWAV